MAITQEAKREMAKFEIGGYVFSVVWDGEDLHLYGFKDGKRVFTFAFTPQENTLNKQFHYGALYDEDYNHISMFFKDGVITTAYLDGVLYGEKINPLKVNISGYTHRIDVQLPNKRRRTIEF